MRIQIRAIKTTMIHKLTLFGILTVLMLSDCSTSTITHSWKSNSPIEINFKKIMVVGLVNPNDHLLRENMENHLTNDLIEKGFEAVSSMQTYGPNSFQNQSEESVLNKLKESGIDAVLTIVLLNKEKEKHYIPGRVYYSPYYIYHRRFWGYYTTIYDRLYEPGYYSESTRYFWESNLYDIANKQLLYSVQTKTFNPSSTEELAHGYGKLICKDLVKKGIFPSN
jgi:hypothetical protein